MKNKSIVIVIALLVGMSLTLPGISEAGHGGHGSAYGWYALGGLATGLFLGAALARPYYYAPAPVYVYPAAPPPVVYTYPVSRPVYAPNQAYACPDPAYAPPPRPAPAGQWVQVPAQWVGDRWVPSHRAWVPANP